MVNVSIKFQCHGYKPENQVTTALNVSCGQPIASARGFLFRVYFHFTYSSKFN